MTQYLQNDLKDFKNILYAYSLCHKDVLRRFWFQSEKNKIFQNFKMRPDGPLGSHCAPPPQWAQQGLWAALQKKAKNVKNSHNVKNSLEMFIRSEMTKICQKRF